MGLCLSVPEHKITPANGGEGLGPGAFDDSPEIPEEVRTRIRRAAASGILLLDHASSGLHGGTGEEVEANVIEAKLGIVPMQIFRLSATLRTLSMARQELVEIPSALGVLGELVELDLSENNLRHLPPSLGLCAKLEALALNENELVDLPPEIGGLKRLRRLVAYRNKLRVLPDELARCESLEEVNFFSNELIRVPGQLATLAHAADINFGGNKLKTFPRPAGWSRCTRLALQWNTIVVSPPIEFMPSLQQLQLAGNPLDELPLGTNLPRLELVDLNRMRLKTLPPTIGQLTALATLTCSSCLLEALPPEIGDCANLATLDLSSNALTHLPVALARCSRLRVLLIRGNRIQTLPRELSALSILKKVDASSNPLNKHDPNTQRVLAAFRAITHDQGGELKL